MEAENYACSRWNYFSLSTIAVLGDSVEMWISFQMEPAASQKSHSEHAVDLVSFLP